MSQNVVHKIAMSRLSGILGGYNSQVGQLRLLARGVSPQVMRPLNIHKEDLGDTSNSRLEYFGNDRDVFDHGCFWMQHVHCD